MIFADRAFGRGRFFRPACGFSAVHFLPKPTSGNEARTELGDRNTQDFVDDPKRI